MGEGGSDMWMRARVAGGGSQVSRAVGLLPLYFVGSLLYLDEMNQDMGQPACNGHDKCEQVSPDHVLRSQ